ncbi:MAG TPA: TOMM precursor leader peptide-binding protein [Blastocatellia bacterium]|nr:TOMM precursor leader peptide-binding protein [Blastocatellia bacterium]
MTDEPSSPKLRALPVQLIETGDGVILKRGRVEIKISGEGALESVQVLLEAAADQPATEEEICALYAEPERAAVARLIHELLDRGLLVPAETLAAEIEVPESSLDVFYWHFGARSGEVRQRLSAVQLVIVGVNSISRQLAGSLRASDLERVSVVDYPLLRNLRLFDDEGALRADQWPLDLEPLEYRDWLAGLDGASWDCLVATSDFGGQQLMREWNRVCLERGCHFLPVVLQDLVGYVGPLVVPGETACYECLRARQNAHLKDPETERAAEYAAFEGQEVVGFHPAMASVLGDVAAIELLKFYGIGPPLWRVGALIEVNLLATALKAHKVLKVPRCAACSALNERSSIALTRSFFPADPAEDQ